jgi:SAM-dependent methyltransferase
MTTKDVPSPVDFHDPVQARQWEENTVRNRPWRPDFFAAFALALNRHFTRPVTILELGSGPGHLAEALLSHCAVRHYTALDFSPAMHDLARARLSSHIHQLEFLIRDFREADWTRGLGPFDAVVTLQAAHETRHRRHLLALLAQARSLLAANGLLLYCDYYAGGNKHPDLFVERDEQPLVLAKAGFDSIRLLRDEGGMALYAAAPSPPTP